MQPTTTGLRSSRLARGAMRLGASLALLLPASCASADPLELIPRGTFDLPASTTDQNGQSFTITGLSGISMILGSGDARHGEFLAVMDNSNKLVRLDVTLAADGSISAAHVLGGISLAQTLDFEGIAATDLTRGTVFLSEENTPAIREYRLSDGALLRTLPTPPVFAARRANFGFESLGSLWLDSSPARLRGTLWTCNEEALTVDGNLSTSSAGSVVRLISYSVDQTTAVPGPQLAYLTEPIHGVAISGSRSGVSDMVVLPDGRVITLERSFAFSALGFFRTRIFEIVPTGATDVSALPGLIGQTYTPVSTANGRKKLLWAGDQTNLEGLTLGPRLPGGSLCLLGIVDDADPISVNRLVAFELRGAGNVPLRRWPR